MASLTNKEAAELVEQAIAAGHVVAAPCPNGDSVTASRGKVIRWGRSEWALPNGKDLIHGPVVPMEEAWLVVEHCGRGNAARAAREKLGL